MSVLPYHKRYHSDALAGFMALTLEERGAYQTLLDMMYDRGGPLIDNERLLAGYMNCSIRKWRQIREQLLAKQKISITSDGQITNRRARKEIENQSKTQRKLIEAGAKGGRTRAENEKKPNENSETEQASLKPASSEAQAIRATTRSQKPEVKSEPNGSGKGGWSNPPVPVDDQVWQDFRSNRKRKRLPETATAYKRLIDDLARIAPLAGMSESDLLTECTAMGWGGIYQPKREIVERQSRPKRDDLDVIYDDLLARGKIEASSG